MTDLTSWQKALDRLVLAPVLSPPQVRFLLDNLGTPRAEWLPVLLHLVGSADPLRADGAAFLLRCALRAEDRPVLAAFLAGPAPLALRAHVRTLYQRGLLSGRLSEADADLPLPAGQDVEFHVEDVVREADGIPSPWQRARVAAEALVGDAPIPDTAAPAAVAALSARLSVDAARVWAELLVHPLTRESFRAAAREALQAPSAAAATHLELAAPQLLPGSLHDTAVAEAARHRAGAPAAAWTARVSGADAGGRFAAVLWTDAPRPAAVAGLFPPDATQGDLWFGLGAQAEPVLALGGRLEKNRSPLFTLPLEAVLQRTGLHALAAPSPDGGKAKKKDKPKGPVFPGLAEFLVEAGLAAPSPEPALPAPAAGPVDAALGSHALLKHVMLVTEDLDENTRQALAKELRRGRPRDETVTAAAKAMAAKRGTVLRLARGMEHGVRVAAALGDPVAPGLARVHQAFLAAAAGEGLPVMVDVVRRTLDQAMPKEGPSPTPRDELRQDVLHAPEPTGRDVLALDLAAAGLEALLTQGKIIDGIADELLTELCADAGRRAAEVVAAFPGGGPTEEAALAEAGREAIRRHGPNLPSRQRREMVEAWGAAWKELLTQACRGSCPQQCPHHVTQPCLQAAFSLDHPRLARPWP